MKKKLSFFLAICLAFSFSIFPGSALELEDAKNLLRTHYIDEIPEDILALDSLDAILAALNDPYTLHMTNEEYESFLTDVNGQSVVGIGVSIQTVFTDGFEVLSVLPDSPALEAGMMAGDRIIAVDGVPLTSNTDITSAIGGAEGTAVTITWVRNKAQMECTMIRRTIHVPIVTYEIFGSAGLIDCTSFGDSTSDVIQEALTTLNDEVSIWIIDLRNNPGGTAVSASAAAGFFVGSNVMAYLVDNDGNATYYFTPGWPDLTDKPLLILTSPYSASGSELFSAAARDLGFGIGLGQRSYGKGIAQIIFDSSNTSGLFDNDSLKLTAYRFYSPDGTTNHIIGIIPSLLVSSENTPLIAELLSVPEPKSALAHLKLELAGHTFYMDLAQARSEEFAGAFTELLEAIPPAAKLFIGESNSEWEPISPAALGARLNLPFQSRSFPDISDSAFAYEIETLAVYKLLSGYEDGSFLPSHSITRAEFCAMVATAMNLPANDAYRSFCDVSSDAWYAGAISAMASRGYIAGYDDGSFRPNETVSYQEAAVILSQVAAWANMNVKENADLDISMNDWIHYYEYAEWAQKAVRNLGDLDALVDGLAPTDLMTREAAASMLCSVLESLNLLWNGK